MGYFDEPIQKKARSVLQEWDQHVNPPAPPPVEAIGASSDLVEALELDLSEDNSKIERKKTYLDLLRAERQQCYEEGSQIVKDADGIPCRPSTTLYCGTWQAWFNEVISSVQHRRVWRAPYSAVCVG